MGFVARPIGSGARVLILANHLASWLQILLLIVLLELALLLIFRLRLAFVDNLLITQSLAELLHGLTFEFLLINFTELVETLVFI